MKEQILITDKQLKWFRETFPTTVYKTDYFQLTPLVTELKKGDKTADFRKLPFEKWSGEHHRIFEGNSIGR